MEGGACLSGWCTMTLKAKEALPRLNGLAGRPPEIELRRPGVGRRRRQSRRRETAVTSLASRSMVNLRKSLPGPVTSFALVAILVASCAARPVPSAGRGACPERSRGAGCRPTAPAAGTRHLRRCAAGDSRCGHTPARLRLRRGVAGCGERHAGTAGAAPRRARAGVCRVQHASRSRIPQGAPRRGPDRFRRPGLAAAARVARHLPDARRLPQVSHGRVPETAAGFRDRRRVARLPPQPRELGAGRAGDAGHLLLRSMPAALPGRHGDQVA